MKNTILVTGASGFLGSAICVDLARDNNVIGMFRREPSEKLRQAAPAVTWEKGDIADRCCIDLAFKRSASRGRPIDYVIHFAAYTDFGEKWHDEYCDTNIIGTDNIIKIASEAGAKRILFAGSIAALEPLPEGEILTEQTLASGNIAYPKSKALGEQLLMQHSDKIPVAVLRIGGVFTDWCELPPLFSVIKLWAAPLIGRMMPGQGNSGFPYIHRKDLVSIVRRIIEKDAGLNRVETFFGSHPGCTFQKELFPVIRKECNRHYSTTPLSMPLWLAKAALHGKHILNVLQRKTSYERAWMINYVDRPLKVDTSYTRKKLDWQPTTGLHILERLPVLMKNFSHNSKAWEKRNIKRNEQNYDYDPD